jgi:uncharacterized protein YbjT (DUF2867 family)
MTITLLVTGATGTVGSQVLRALAERNDVTVRAPGRDELDFTRPETFAPALRGVDRVFLLAPAMADQVGASARFLDACRTAGVAHVVKLSALGCDDEPTIAFGRAHRDVEQLLAASGMAWTCLRPNNFMDNFLGARHGAFAPDADGTIALPWGDAACSFIAAADIGAVTARVLAEAGHAGRVYELTGGEALGLAAIAGILSEASGRAIRYVDTPEPAVRARLLAAHMPPPMVAGVLELHALGKAGRAAKVTPTVAALLGRPPTTFAAFARAQWSTR